MANIWGALQSTITEAYKTANQYVKATWIEITATIIDEGLSTERRALDTVVRNESGVVQSAGTQTDPMYTQHVDSNGRVEGEVGYVGPIVQAREPACFVSITPASLTTNVYTVTGAPAKGIEVINDSAGDITVTVSDGVTSILETLKPDDTYKQTFEIDVETVTFSAGAVFRADLLR